MAANNRLIRERPEAKEKMEMLKVKVCEGAKLILREQKTQRRKSFVIR
jgi:hypothetical protein